MSDGTTHSTPSGSDRAALLERRLKRERNAREQAEALLREKTQSLYATLQKKPKCTERFGTCTMGVAGVFLELGGRE